MNRPASAIIVLAVCAQVVLGLQQVQQLAGWSQHPQAQQFAPQRQPIAADLQNQVNALSSQLAAANRQLQYFQQQLSLVAQHQQTPVSPQQVVGSQVSSPQYFAQGAQSNPPTQPQATPVVSSTLVDQNELSDPQFGSQFYQAQQPRLQLTSQSQQQQQQHQQLQLQQQQQQQQQLEQQEQQRNQLLQQQQVADLEARRQQQQLQAQSRPTSTTVGPPSIEPSLSVPTQVTQQAPSINQSPPHQPARNDDKFSIGLGVLSPGYTQKFGNTALDFNQDKDGFSFTLSNNGHNNNNQQQQPAKNGQQSTAN